MASVGVGQACKNRGGSVPFFSRGIGAVYAPLGVVIRMPPGVQWTSGVCAGYSVSDVSGVHDSRPGRTLAGGV